MILVFIMGITPLIPAAVSAKSPQWVWDSQGKVHDATGQYRRLSDEEACLIYNLCPAVVALGILGSAGSGDSDNGPGCFMWEAHTYHA